MFHVFTKKFSVYGINLLKVQKLPQKLTRDNSSKWIRHMSNSSFVELESYTMLKIKLRWWIGEDSLGIVALGIVSDITQCYNLGKTCLPVY